MGIEDANIGNNSNDQYRVIGRKSWLSYSGVLVRYGIIGGILYYAFINYERLNRELLIGYPFQLTQDIFVGLFVVLV